jgi:hypothetical protein
MFMKGIEFLVDHGIATAAALHIKLRDHYWYLMRREWKPNGWQLNDPSNNITFFLLIYPERLLKKFFNFSNSSGVM